MSVVATESSVRVNRVTLVVVVAAAQVAGLAPYVFLVQQWWLFGLVVVLALGGAIPGARGHTTRATRAPGWLEWLLAGGVATGKAGAVALIGVLIHLIVGLAVRAIVWIAGKLGFALSLDPEGIGFAFSISVVALTVLAQAIGATRDLAGHLYPRTAGLGSKFYGVATYHAKSVANVLLALVVVVVGGGLVAWFEPDLATTWWIALFWCWMLVLVGVTIEGRGRSKPATHDSHGAVADVKALFEAAGYDVVVSPRTEREDLDPLLADSVDLYAERGGRGFAIDVQTGGGEARESDRLSAPAITTAAWALRKFFREEASAEEGTAAEAVGVPVKAVVVVVGGRPSHSIQVAEMRGDVLLVAAGEPAELRRLVGLSDPEERRRRASALLRPLAADGIGPEPEEAASGPQEAVEAT